MTIWTTTQRAARDRALKTLTHYLGFSADADGDHLEEIEGLIDNLILAARPDPDGTPWPVPYTPPAIRDLRPEPSIGRRVWLDNGDLGHKVEIVSHIEPAHPTPDNPPRIVLRDHATGRDEELPTVDWAGKYPEEGPLLAICSEDDEDLLVWWADEGRLPVPEGAPQPAPQQQLLLREPESKPAEFRQAFVIGLRRAGPITSVAMYWPAMSSTISVPLDEWCSPEGRIEMVWAPPGGSEPGANAAAPIWRR